MWSSTEPKLGSAGFTLIEVLVALAIVATALASIGALIASTARGTRSTDAHLHRLEIARAVMTAIPERDQLKLNDLSGEIAGHPWRVEVSPFVSRDVGLDPRASWQPQRIVVTVRSPSGGAMQLSTVRLQRGSGR